MIRLSRFCASILTVTALAGCGIAAQNTPEPITPPAGAAIVTPTPPPDATPAGRTPEILYFVKDNMIVRITRHITGTPTTQHIIKDLLAGPNDTENADGYTSALLGDNVVHTVHITAGKATVALTTPVADTARNDEVLAYAQLVCTLTALPQISGVTFTNNGQPVAVPRGDGSLPPLTNGQPTPLTATDYTDLIER